MSRTMPPRSTSTPAPPNGTSGSIPACASPFFVFAATTLTVPLDGDSVTVRDGTTPSAGVDAWPDTVVVLVMLPCLISACVTTYRPAVHVNVPSGASDCVGQVTVNPGPAGADNTSCTRISDIITFPVLVTTNEYDTRSPARDTVAGVALFTTDNPGVRVTDTTPADEPADPVRAGALPSNGVGPCPHATPPPPTPPPPRASAPRTGIATDADTSQSPPPPQQQPDYPQPESQTSSHSQYLSPRTNTTHSHPHEKASQEPHS